MGAAIGSIAGLHFDFPLGKPSFQLNAGEVLFCGVSQGGLNRFLGFGNVGRSAGIGAKQGGFNGNSEARACVAPFLRESGGFFNGGLRIGSFRLRRQHTGENAVANRGVIDGVQFFELSRGIAGKRFGISVLFFLERQVREGQLGFADGARLAKFVANLQSLLVAFARGREIALMRINLPQEI